MKILVKFFLIAEVILLASCQEKDNRKLDNQDAMAPVELSDITVNGELGRRIDITINNNLFELKIDKDFIRPFQKKNGESGYIGIGKLVDASVKLAHYSGDTDVVELKNHLVAELLKTQGRDGYIGMLKKKSRMKKLWDIHEMGYIIYGLVSDYRYFDNQNSLDAAIGLADYVIQNWSKEAADGWPNVARHVGITGFDRALIALYEQTDNQQYLDFLTGELQIPEWNLEIVLGRKKKIEGHIYAYITRCLAQLELYSLTEDDQLLQPAMRAIRFLTEKEGMLINGGAGQWECWTNDQDGGHALGETCATSYQIRLYEKLLRMKGDPWYGDLMERTIYNALFAAQSPEGRKIRYYTPIAGERKYFEEDTYCCPNNYRRIISELPGYLYYRYKNGIAINLYAPSKAIIDQMEVPVTIKQITDYPNSGVVKIVVSPTSPTRFPLWLRIPSWAENPTVSSDINSKKTVKPGSFIKIERQWTGNDTIRLNIPMDWRFIRGRQRQAGRIAIMRGPILYCLNPELNKGLGFENMNSYDLGRIIIDPGSVRGPFPDKTVRPEGTKCMIGAWNEGHGMGGEHDFELVLTEFIDPNGEVCYFSVRDFQTGEDDGLLKLKDTEVELYDLEEDQVETNNLAREQPELVSEFLDKLLDYRRLRSATGVPPMVEPVPAWWKPPDNWDLERAGEPLEKDCH